MTNSGTFFLGCALAIAGNIVVACSLCLQKHVHNAHEAKLEAGEAEGKTASSNPLFWVALSGMILGEVGNFTAFGLASPTVVSPLGAVAVITNALLAVLFLGETLRVRGVVGILLTIGGSIIVVVFAPPSLQNLTVSDFVDLLKAPPVIALLSFIGTGVTVLGLLEPRFGKRFLLIDIGLCSLLGTITVLCSSSVSKFIEIVANGDDSLLRSPIPYVLIPLLGGTAVLQLMFLNRAMMNFDSTQVVPVYYVVFTLCSIGGGGIFFHDFWR